MDKITNYFVEDLPSSSDVFNLTLEFKLHSIAKHMVCNDLKKLDMIKILNSHYRVYLTNDNDDNDDDKTDSETDSETTNEDFENEYDITDYVIFYIKKSGVDLSY